jgi:hypothetical protein
MLLAGIGWLVSANALAVSVQMALPDWFRARGMSTFQMSMMGASALGAAVWEQVATACGVREEDLTPSRDAAGQVRLHRVGVIAAL